MRPEDLTGYGNYSKISNKALVLANIEIILAKKSAGARKALDEHVNKVFVISNENYCPVDKGNLKASGKKVVTVDSEQEKTWRISYGGSSEQTFSLDHSFTVFGSGDVSMGYSGYVNYAAIVHENLNARHYNPPSACAKYLERAVNENDADFKRTIADGVKYGY